MKLPCKLLKLCRLCLCLCVLHQPRTLLIIPIDFGYYHVISACLFFNSFAASFSWLSQLVAVS